jgi:hypothetical protein
MLIKWITTGHLSDPFDEFMVKESGHITKGVLESDYTDEYWERRYTVRLFIPTFVSYKANLAAPRRFLLGRVLKRSSGKDTVCGRCTDA